MNRILNLILIVGVGLMLSACPKKPTTVPSTRTGETVGSTGANSAGANSGSIGQATPIGGASGSGSALTGALAKTTILFEYDSAEIKPEFNATIAAHGQHLAGDRTLHVRLEGNTDERGSAEYNVALGERRAQAVKRALLLQGATAEELSTVSYGSERPVASGHDESAWSQNRRVEIVYSGAR